LERINDPFIKAIWIVETWRTEEDYIHAWNDFFQGKADTLDARFVYLGQTIDNEYLGCNGCFVINQNNLQQVFCQINRLNLARFYNRAWNMVKVLLIMDCIDVWEYCHFRRYGLIHEPFDFCFYSCDI
jgi:hypothetical protein